MKPAKDFVAQLLTRWPGIEVMRQVVADHAPEKVMRSFRVRSSMAVAAALDSAVNRMAERAFQLPMSARAGLQKLNGFEVACLAVQPGNFSACLGQGPVHLMADLTVFFSLMADCAVDHAGVGRCAVTSTAFWNIVDSWRRMSDMAIKAGHLAPMAHPLFGNLLNLNNMAFFAIGEGQNRFCPQGIRQT